MNLSYLEATLTNLRAKWPDQWPGMGVVVNQALQQLGYVEGMALSTQDQALRNCIDSVIEMIEADGKARHAAQQEPSYHNRLHFSDATVCLTALLLNQRIASRQALDVPPSHSEWVAMLAIVSHDFLHTGKINQFPSEIELHSIDALRPHMAQHGVAPEDQELIRELILKTDPSFVPACHEAVQGIEFNINNPKCLTVLIQESDILASSLPGIGNQLTVQLSDEWADVSPERSQSLLGTKSRIFFLRHMALFSSPSSRLLGIQPIIDREIQRLELG